MFWILVSVIILVICLFNYKKVNEMFNKPTVEELESYQESVFLHIDEEIAKYKKDIASEYKNKGIPMIKELNEMITVLDERIAEFKEIEKRIDEKIVKLDEFRRMI